MKFFKIWKSEENVRKIISRTQVYGLLSCVFSITIYIPENSAYVIELHLNQDTEKEVLHIRNQSRHNQVDPLNI